MLCPYCTKEAHLVENIHGIQLAPVQQMILSDHWYIRDSYYIFRGGYCPACHRPIILSHRASSDLELDEVSSEEFGINDFPTLVFPSKKALKSSPPEVPIEYGEDFREARLVFDISPKSSAALCRRLLQRIIHVLYNIKRRDLQTEIQELIDTINPPSHLSDQLQTIRVVGNFAAHPMKNQATGEIHDVEPGEADWMIATVENFMDFAFVQPARSAALKAAINAKLVAAGKPLLP